MRNVTKTLAVLSFAAAVAVPAFAASQAENSNGSGTAPVASGAPAYGAPVFGPGYYGPPAYYGPHYGHGYGRGYGSGSGRVTMSFDFDGFANGWAPWRGWWW
jgi:hypothetical protein